MKFRVFLNAQGRVLSACSGPDAALALQPIPPGGTDLYVDAPQPPTPGHTHLGDGRFGWQFSLDELKDQKWDALKRQRDEAEYGGFDWDGSRFDSDPASQSRVQGASQLASLALIHNQPFSIDWSLADNSVRTLDANQMLAVGQAMGLHIATQHGKGRLRREQLNAATNPDQVQAVPDLSST